MTNGTKKTLLIVGGGALAWYLFTKTKLLGFSGMGSEPSQEESLRAMVEEKKAERTAEASYAAKLYQAAAAGGGGSVGAQIRNQAQPLVDEFGKYGMTMEDAVWFVPIPTKTVDDDRSWFAKVADSFDKVLDTAVGEELSDVIQSTINAATFNIAGDAAAAGGAHSVESDADAAIEAANQQAMIDAQKPPVAAYAIAATPLIALAL